MVVEIMDKSKQQLWIERYPISWLLVQKLCELVASLFGTVLGVIIALYVLGVI